MSIRNHWIWALTLTLTKYYDFHLTELPVKKQKRVVPPKDEQTERLPQIVLLRNRVRDFQMVRIQAANYVWGSHLTRDIRFLSDQAAVFRKRLRAKRLDVRNLYVFPFSEELSIQENLENIEYIKQDKAELITKGVYFQEPFYSIGNEEKSEESWGMPGTMPVDAWDLQMEKLQLEKWNIDPGEVEKHVRYYLSHLTIDEMKQEVKKEDRKKEEQFNAVFRHGRPIFTYLFLAVNILMFLFLEWVGSSTDPATLVRYGAKWNPHILDGEYWRLITPMFLHIGYLHIFFNSVALFFLGGLVERIYGSFRFFWIYFFAGFCGTLVSFGFIENIAAGASGAIFGCFGAMLYFGIKYRDLFFRTVGMDVIVILLINLGIGALIPMIDNYGHVGGLIGGFLAAAMVSLPHKSLIAERTNSTIITAVLVLVFLLFGFRESSTSPYYYLYNAELAYEIGYYEYGLQFVERAKSAGYDEPEFEMLSGMLYSKLGDFARAEHALRHSKEQGVDYPTLYFELGKALYKLEQFEDAREHLIEAIHRIPSFGETYYYLALTYTKQELWDEASEVIDFASRKGIEDPRFQEIREIIQMNNANESFKR